MVQGVLNEMREGRGPVYMDCRGIAPEAQKHLIATLSCDKDSFKDYFEQLGIDLTTTPMEVDTSEGMQGGPNEVCGSGVKINKDCGTNVPGLYAGGNGAAACTWPSPAASMPDAWPRTTAPPSPPPPNRTKPRSSVSTSASTRPSIPNAPSAGRNSK